MREKVVNFFQEKKCILRQNPGYAYASLIYEAGARVQVIAESRVGELEDQLRRAKAQLDDDSRQLQDANALKARLGQENLELHRHLQDLDTGNAILSKAKTALQQELEETKMKLDDETRVTDHALIKRNT